MLWGSKEKLTTLNYIPIAKLLQHRARNKFQQQSVTPLFTGEIINIFVVVVEKFNDETLKLARVNYDWIENLFEMSLFN